MPRSSRWVATETATASSTEDWWAETTHAEDQYQACVTAHFVAMSLRRNSTGIYTPAGPPTPWVTSVSAPSTLRSTLMWGTSIRALATSRRLANTSAGRMIRSLISRLTRTAEGDNARG